MLKQEINPIVSVNILSYNRCDELRITLTKVFEQSYKEIELIVVDNASTDGSPEMVEKEFPQVNIIKLKKNIGIAGWNEGFKVALGKYILVLDDDAYPADDAISKAIKEFESDNKIACVALNTYDLNSGQFINDFWSPSELTKEEKFYWPIFIGCSAMFSAERVNLENLMPTDYFIYQHELPVAAEIYLKGYKILFNKNIIAYHRFKDSNLYNKIHDQYRLKNNLLFINKYLPIYLSFFYSLQAMFYFLTRSIKKKWVTDYFRIIMKVNYLNRDRRIIQFSYFLKLRRLHLFNFSILSKIK